MAQEMSDVCVNYFCSQQLAVRGLSDHVKLLLLFASTLDIVEMIAREVLAMFKSAPVGRVL